MTTTSPLRRVPTRVGTLAVADEGAGTPVVLWPSLFSDHRLFSPLVPLLGEGWRTLRIDGPGFGLSDAPRGEVQPDVYADAVLDLLDALGLEQALLAGCSWGGQIAAHLGVKAPNRVSGVLILNTPLGPSLGGHAFEVWGTRWFGSTGFWGHGVARSMFSPASRKAHPERVRAFATAFTSFDPAAAAVTARTVLTRFPGLGDVLPRLAVPTTILMGAEDRLYPVERMRPFAALAPTATLEVVPSCGHLAPLEAPEAVAAALRGLAGGRSPRRTPGGPQRS
jgi:3-oxoadipate enol-lactonase